MLRQRRLGSGIEREVIDTITLGYLCSWGGFALVDFLNARYRQAFLFGGNTPVTRKLDTIF